MCQQVKIKFYCGIYCSKNKFQILVAKVTYKDFSYQMMKVFYILHVQTKK